MPAQLKEGEDFYFNEEGLMVLTEKYHLKRGVCCGNKCSHCPYNWKNVKEVSNGKSGDRSSN